MQPMLTHAVGSVGYTDGCVKGGKYNRHGSWDSHMLECIMSDGARGCEWHPIINTIIFLGMLPRSVPEYDRTFAACTPLIFLTADVRLC
jgi:hypothetical protein